MSMATLERAIVASARVVLKNPKIRVKDLREWCTSEIKAIDGEVIVYVTDPGCWAAFPKALDRRTA